jgi:actin-related protein
MLIVTVVYIYLIMSLLFSKLKNELSDSSEGSGFNMSSVPERQFSSWIGGSIVASLDNFQYMWVTKQSYDECEKKLCSIDSKCF